MNLASGEQRLRDPDRRFEQHFETWDNASCPMDPTPCMLHSVTDS